MRRFYQVLLIASTLALSWLGMMVIHEAGHLIAGHLCGETVRGLVLHPLAVSQTEVTHDHYPLLVIWAGPLVGSLVPWCAYRALRCVGSRATPVVRFFAGFCLVANGLYLGVGSFWRVGDAGDLVRYGSPQSLLVGFAIVVVPIGFRLWHKLGEEFGLGRSVGAVDRGLAVGTALALVGLVLIEVLLDLR